MTTNGHLNANQIDALLMGDASRRTQSHLESCAECRARVAEAESSFKDFRVMAVAWSERKSATMPTSLSAALAHRASVRQPLAWSGAAMVLFAVGLFTTMSLTRVPDASQMESTKNASGYSMTAEDLAGDNQMLDEIDRELGNSGNTAALGLKDTSGDGHGSGSQVED
jgi:predicted anti-sigma-YlaC factor YlaD